MTSFRPIETSRRAFSTPIGLCRHIFVFAKYNLLTMTLFDDMMKKAASADGFLAALDQSGGSTPNALKEYGVPDDVS
jgi:hypothetical protein